MQHSRKGYMMNVNKITDDVKNGQIPDTLGVKTDFAKELTRVSANITPTSAILIAAARRDNFANNNQAATEWIDWAKENFKFNDSTIHKMRRVGVLLLQTMEQGDKELFEDLLTLDIDKTDSLSRLDLDDFNSFIEENDIHSMDREEVRDLVNKNLGDPKKTPNKQSPKKKVNPNDIHGMEFCFFVNEISRWGEDVIVQASDNPNINAASAASASMRLLNIAVRKMEAGDELDAEDRNGIVSMLEGALQDLKSGE